MRCYQLSFLTLAIVTAACADQSPTEPAAFQPQAAAQNSEQVIFSGVASGSLGARVGFWIWCEADSENPYAGECNGAIRFADTGLTRHVEGEVEEPSEGIYLATVESTRDDTVSCTLVNAAEAVHGPNNTVMITCTTPAGTATATGAVVNVTGP